MTWFASIGSKTRFTFTSCQPEEVPHIHHYDYVQAVPYKKQASVGFKFQGYLGMLPRELRVLLMPYLATRVHRSSETRWLKCEDEFHASSDLAYYESLDDEEFWNEFFWHETEETFQEFLRRCSNWPA